MTNQGNTESTSETDVSSTGTAASDDDGHGAAEVNEVCSRAACVLGGLDCTKKPIVNEAYLDGWATEVRSYGVFLNPARDRQTLSVLV